MIVSIRVELDVFHTVILSCRQVPVRNGHLCRKSENAVSSRSVSHFHLFFFQATSWCFSIKRIFSNRRTHRTSIASVRSTLPFVGSIRPSTSVSAVIRIDRRSIQPLGNTSVHWHGRNSKRSHSTIMTMASPPSLPRPRRRNVSVCSRARRSPHRLPSDTPVRIETVASSKPTVGRTLRFSRTSIRSQIQVPIRIKLEVKSRRTRVSKTIPWPLRNRWTRCSSSRRASRFRPPSSKSRFHRRPRTSSGNPRARLSHPQKNAFDLAARITRTRRIRDYNVRCPPKYSPMHVSSTDVKPRNSSTHTR